MPPHLQWYPDKFELNLEKKQFNSLAPSSQATSESCGFPTPSPWVKLSAGKLEAGGKSALWFTVCTSVYGVYVCEGGRCRLGVLCITGPNDAGD